jgi:hypothetical protein
MIPQLKIPLFSAENSFARQNRYGRLKISPSRIKLKITLFFMSTLSFGMATQARAQTVGCAANGCSQLFGVTGSLSTSYSANYALTTAPSLKITSGWVVAPTGLTNLSQGGLPHYIEAGPIKICSLDCDKIYPYTTAVDLQGIPSFYIHRSSSWSDPGLQRYYGVKYSCPK